MAQVPLSLATLGDVAGGAAGFMIDRDMSAFSADLDDRGDDGKPRKLVITVIGVKRKDGQVELELESELKLPKRRTPSTVAKLGSKSGEISLLFQQHAPENPSQRTIDEATE